jgi:hypothetical protein
MDPVKVTLTLMPTAPLPVGFNWTLAVQFMLRGTPFKAERIEVDVTPPKQKS